MKAIALLVVSVTLAHAGAIPLKLQTPASESVAENAPATVTECPVPRAPVRGTQPIPFQSGPFFAENRVGDRDVKLPPLPPSLFPVPPAERRPTPVILPPPSLLSQTASERARGRLAAKATPPPATVPANETTTADSQTNNDSQEQNIAVSPFVNWINKTPDAAEIARRSQKEYSVNGVAENSLGSADLFYNIRFPYVANEQTPPGASAVIYSTPKK